MSEEKKVNGFPVADTIEFVHNQIGYPDVKPETVAPKETK